MPVLIAGNAIDEQSLSRASSSELRRAGGQQIGFAGTAAAPDRSHGVDHEPGRQPESRRDSRLSRRTSADRAAGALQLRSRRAVNRAVDTAASYQRFVRRVHDRVDGLACDVANDNVEPRHERFLARSRTRYGAYLALEKPLEGFVDVVPARAGQNTPPRYFPFGHSPWYSGLSSRSPRRVPEAAYVRSALSGG